MLRARIEGPVLAALDLETDAQIAGQLQATLRVGGLAA